MRVVISGRHTHLSEKLKEYARQKAGRLERFDGSVTRAELVLSREVTGSPRQADRTHGPATGAMAKVNMAKSAAELIVSVAREHTPFVARADGENLYAAVDLAVDKMKRQLRRYKEKRQARGQGRSRG